MIMAVNVDGFLPTKYHERWRGNRGNVARSLAGCWPFGRPGPAGIAGPREGARPRAKRLPNVNDFCFKLGRAQGVRVRQCHGDQQLTTTDGRTLVGTIAASPLPSLSFIVA